MDDPSATLPEGFAERTEQVREHDRFLPIANIARVIKQSLPPHGEC